LLRCWNASRRKISSGPLLKALQLPPYGLAGSSPRNRFDDCACWAWLLNFRQIEYFALLASPLLWGTNLAILIERWRRQNREGLARWLDSLGEFEALSVWLGIATKPDHTFAILNPQSSPLFHAEALGHPLLDRQTCVRCDLQLDGQTTQLIMVSGSNMAGKSTLLRAVGLNSVLALAGAPVRAARLQISPLQIGCSISVHDFPVAGKIAIPGRGGAAEVDTQIYRARTTSSFLLDEMLGGTNSG